MSLTYRVLQGAAIGAAIGEVARLRIEVFRDLPYLYDGDEAYEARYLQSFAASSGGIVVLAEAAGRVVGASTGMPLSEADPAFVAALSGGPVDPARIFYCAESVLLSRFRGTGAGRRFFAERETHARTLGLSHSAFCGVVRPDDHPMRPEGYVPLDAFWRRLGYAPVAGAVVCYGWTDLGEDRETEKPLQFWMKALEG